MLDKDDSDQLLDRIKKNEFFTALEKFKSLLDQFGKDVSDAPDVPVPVVTTPLNSLDPPDIPDIPDIPDPPDIPDTPDTPIDLREDGSFHEVDKENNKPLKRKRKRLDYSILDLQDASDNGSSDGIFVEEPKRRKSQKQRETYKQQTASGRKALDEKRELFKDKRKRS